MTPITPEWFAATTAALKVREVEALAEAFGTEAFAAGDVAAVPELCAALGIPYKDARRAGTLLGRIARESAGRPVRLVAGDRPTGEVRRWWVEGWCQPDA